MQPYTYFIVQSKQPHFVAQCALFPIISNAVLSSTRMPISVITNVVHGLLGPETLKVNIV